MGALTVTTLDSIVAYESMCRWIAESESLADCKDIADKSAALKEYARHAKNQDAERRASNVRLIAERRYGELLRELARAGAPNPVGLGGKSGKIDASTAATHQSPYAQALTDTGVSRQQAHRYQALADVPQATFDEALRTPEIPTRSGVLAKAEAVRVVQEARDPVPKMPAHALWLWGRLRDLESDGYFNRTPAEFFEPVTETMLADMRRLLPLARDFFNELTEAIHESA